MKSGIVIVYKKEGMSSHTATAKLRRLLGANKTGHTGTLDPLAEGVLPILVERGVKCKRGQDSRGIAGSYTNEL